MDVLGHINNAAYLHPVEDVRAGRPVARLTLEYRQPLSWGEEVSVAVAAAAAGGSMWFAQGGEIRAAALLEWSELAS
jgi:acyl-ACP thioesterase